MNKWSLTAIMILLVLVSFLFGYIKGSNTKVSNNEVIVDEIKAKDIDEDEVNYDNMPTRNKIQLLASIVDDRANMEAFTIYYSIEGDNVFIMVHSGAGVGHPIYKIKIGSSIIKPIDGVVHNGIGSDGLDIHERLGVSVSQIYKGDLYRQYIRDRDSYEFSENIVELNKSMTTENYEWIKSRIP